MARVYRIGLCGGICGKSPFVKVYVGSPYVDEYDPTIEDSYRKQVSVDAEVCMLDLLDISGSEMFSAMRDQYFRMCEGWLIFISVRRAQTIDDARSMWKQLLRVQDAVSFPLVLVGQMADDGANREVSYEQGLALARELGCYSYWETSAKENVHVTEAFEDMVRAIRRAPLDPLARLGAKPAASLVRPGSWAKVYKWNREKKRLAAATPSGSVAAAAAAASAAPSATSAPEPVVAELPAPEPPSLTVLPSSVYQDLSKLFDNPAAPGADCVIVVGGRRITAHRVVLALRSSHFRDVFVAGDPRCPAAGDEIYIGDAGAADASSLPAAAAEALKSVGEAYWLALKFCYAPFSMASVAEPMRRLIANINRQLGISGLNAALFARGKADPAPAALLSSDAMARDMAAVRTDFDHLADVVLVCEGHRVPVHKAIVCVRSSWFSALLTGKFAESNTAEVAINSMRYVTLSHIVDYLYTGRLSAALAPEDALDVLAAANMLALPRAVNLCERALAPLLAADNVIPLWQAACHHEAAQLKEQCVHAMVANFDELSKLKEWRRDVDGETQRVVSNRHAAWRAQAEARQRADREAASAAASCLGHPYPGQ